MGPNFSWRRKAHSSSVQGGEGQRSSCLHTVREFHQLQLTQNVLFSDAVLRMKTGFLLQENLRYSCSHKSKISFSHAMQHLFLCITKIQLFCLCCKHSVNKRFLEDTRALPNSSNHSQDCPATLGATLSINTKPNFFFLCKYN